MLVYKTDRLSRGGGPGWAPLLDVAEAAGLNPDRLVATPSGWVSEFEIGIRATTDREEARKMSDRALDNHVRLAEAGRYSGGLRPFGFNPDMSHHPTEAALIRDAIRRGGMSLSSKRRLHLGGARESER